MKYIISSDLRWLIKNKKTILMLIIVVPLFPIFLNFNISDDITKLLTINMGTNLSSDSYGIIEILMFLFNIFIFQYLILSTYLKDLEGNLENIFLRVNPGNYILKKNLIFTVIIIIIKLIQYIILVLLIMLFKNSNIDFELIKLMISDISFILLVQYLVLFIYLFNILLNKNIVFIVISLLVFMILIPKNILMIYDYLYIVITIIIFTQGLIFGLFLKKTKKLIENL